jgi:hypothetical protein
MAQLAQGFVDGILTLAGIKTTELCITDTNGSTCIDREKLDALIKNAATNQGGGESTDNSDDTPEGGSGDEEGTTGTTTDDGIGEQDGNNGTTTDDGTEGGTGTTTENTISG